MLSGDGNEDSQNKLVGLISKKKNFARAEHFFCTFLCRCLLHYNVNRNFLVTRFMEEILYVFLFTFLLLPLVFTVVAASISHFLTAAIKVSCFSSIEICLFCFLSLALALSRSQYGLLLFPRYHVNVSLTGRRF